MVLTVSLQDHGIGDRPAPVPTGRRGGDFTSEMAGFGKVRTFFPTFDY